MADSDDLISQFCAITGATRTRGTSFLEAAGNNLQVAIDTFYSEGGMEEEQQVPPPPSDVPGHKPAPEKSNKVASLSDYRSSDKPQGGDDEGQSFFAGGSEHSGQMISGPPKKKKDVAKEVFEAAKNQGAVPLEELQKEEKSKKFQGAGFRLGDTEGPSQSIPGIRVSVKPDKVSKKLTFWKNGFSVDDGPLRADQTPEDMAFLQSISKGQIPDEFLREAKGGEVDIDLEDRRNEDYVAPKPKIVPFSGAGQKLGNIAPDVVQGEASTTATPPTTGHTPSVELDSSQPVTSVQIRLADGSRLVAKFNHLHTVGDIRQYIINSHPEMASRGFNLMTTFPNKVLTDNTQTLSDAKLLNAVVVQRYI